MTQPGSHLTDICSERETNGFGQISFHFMNMNIAESVDLGRKTYGKNKRFNPNREEQRELQVDIKNRIPLLAA